MQKLVIENFKCPSRNDSYAGQHWTKRRKKAKTIQALVFAECKKQNIQPVEQICDIEVVAYYKYKIRRDSDNVSSKEIIDGLVLAGILKDDSVEFVRKVTTLAKIGQKKDKVVVKLEHAESAVC